MQARSSFAALALSAALLAGSAQAGSAQDECRVGVFFMNDGARSRVLDGVEGALGDHPSAKVKVISMPYRRLEKALEDLVARVEAGEVDLVIGPTESDLFVRAMELSDVFEEHRVPVVSPLITAESDGQANSADGWFFRTNVGVSPRSRVVYDQLRKEWIRSMAVLYADTEFGRQAEAAFRKEHFEEFGDDGNYSSRPYDPPPEVRTELRAVLARRPEALGIFGEREDIPVVLSELDSMVQGGTPYRPVVFTVLDARETKGLTHDLLFASVASPTASGAQVHDDVYGLAYDTTELLVDVLGAVGPPPSGGEERLAWRERLRNQFTVAIRGGSPFRGRYTGMQFSKSVNVAVPRIWQIRNGEVAAPDGVDGWLGLLWRKVGRIRSRFGDAPLAILVAILLAVALNSLWDLGRWYEGGFVKLRSFWGTWVLIGAQFLVAVALFAWLAETGAVRYDSWTAAFVIGFTPSQLMRLKVAETPAGKSIGVVTVYDGFLRWLNDGFMHEKYKRLQPSVELLAQYCCETDMRQALESLFSNQRNAQRRQRLEAGLQEKLQPLASSWERRMALAREMIRHFRWRDLWEQGFLPPGVKDDEDNVSGPMDWIRRSHRHVQRTPGGVATLLKALEEEEKTYGDLQKERLRKKLEESETPSDKTFTRIRFLVLNLGYDEARLRARELLPTAAEDDAHPDARATIVPSAPRGDAADPRRNGLRKVLNALASRRPRVT